MKKILLITFCLLGSFTAMTQQDPIYAHYILNPFVINPAYAGFSKDLSALASYRRQWSGITGSPETTYASGHIALRSNSMGLGAVVSNDKIGSSENVQVIAAYAYHLNLSGDARISFGLRGGLVNYRMDFSGLTIDETDPRFQGSINETLPAFGAGVIFTTDKVYVGLSVPDMLTREWNAGEVQSNLYKQHAYGYFAYMLPMSSRLKLKPFAVARAVKGAPLNFDAGAILTIDDSYSFGLFSRAFNTYGALIRLHVGETLRVGYAFELPTAQSVGTNFTTHEFTLGIRMAVFRSHDIVAVSDF